MKIEMKVTRFQNEDVIATSGNPVFTLAISGFGDNFKTNGKNPETDPHPNTVVWNNGVPNGNYSGYKFDGMTGNLQNVTLGTLQNMAANGQDNKKYGDFNGTWTLGDGKFVNKQIQ